MYLSIDQSIEESIDRSIEESIDESIYLSTFRETPESTDVMVTVTGRPGVVFNGTGHNYSIVH